MLAPLGYEWPIGVWSSELPLVSLQAGAGEPGGGALYLASLGGLAWGLLPGGRAPRQTFSILWYGYVLGRWFCAPHLLPPGKRLRLSHSRLQENSVAILGRHRVTSWVPTRTLWCGCARWQQRRENSERRSRQASGPWPHNSPSQEGISLERCCHLVSITHPKFRCIVLLRS